MKLRYILPSLIVAPIVTIATIVPTTSCKKSGSEEEKKPKATKIEFENIVDGQEFDVATVPSFNIKAKVYPAEADQNVSYKIITQDGQGDLACSRSGEFHTNNSVGTCKIKAISKDGECASDIITLRFYDSRQFKFFHTGEEYLVIVQDEYINLEYCIIPTMYNNEYITATSLGAFYRCTKLKYVLFPTDEHFKSISAYSFFGCSNLTSVDIPDNITYIMDYAFRDCASLTEVNLGKKVGYIGACAFYACDHLTSINLSESLEIINDQAFDYCTTLKSIIIPKNVNYIGDGAFSNCWKCEISVDPENDKFVYVNDTDHDGLYNKNMTRLICGNQLYKGNKFNVPNTVKTIDNSGMMFMDMLEEVNIPDGVTTIGRNAFSFCNKLEKVNLPATLSTIKQGTFFFCTNLTEMTIPASVNKIEERAFYWCNNIASITFTDTTKTWKITNAMTGLDIAAYSTTDAVNNADKLTVWGYMGTSGWVGGYSVATWEKNN